MIFLLILIGVFLNTSAQLLLKAGMNQIGQFEFSWANILPVGLKIFENWPILGGLSIYVLSVLIWLMVLSRVPVSFAYPMVSLGYVLNALAAYYFFGEPLHFMRIAGILIIMAGVYLVAQSN